MDIMQFVRELLEDKPPSMGVRGVVTHVVRIFTQDPGDPALYEIQMEINGNLYYTMAITRHPLLQDLQVGEEVIASKPEPEAEGFPIFLLLTKPAEKIVVKAEGTEVGKSDFEDSDPVPPPFDPDARDEERQDVTEMATV